MPVEDGEPPYKPSKPESYTDLEQKGGDDLVISGDHRHNDSGTVRVIVARQGLPNSSPAWWSHPSEVHIDAPKLSTKTAVLLIQEAVDILAILSDCDEAKRDKGIKELLDCRRRYMERDRSSTAFILNPRYFRSTEDDLH